MKKLLGVVLMIFVMSLALAGCGPKDVVVTQEMNGQKVTVKPGAEVTVELPGNPTTGYTWEATDLDVNVLKQAGEAEFKAESDLLGAPGMITLKFEAVAAGETTLKLIYHRTFEEGVAPESTFEVNVVVK